MYLNPRLKFVLAANALLLIPLTAMQFSSEVNWSAFDFLIMGLMLSILALTLEFLFRKYHMRKALIWTFVAIFFFVLLWAEMAVGLFNSPIAGS